MPRGEVARPTGTPYDRTVKLPRTAPTGRIAPIGAARRSLRADASMEETGPRRLARRASRTGRLLSSTGREMHGRRPLRLLRQTGAACGSSPLRRTVATRDRSLLRLTGGMHDGCLLRLAGAMHDSSLSRSHRFASEDRPSARTPTVCTTAPSGPRHRLSRPAGLPLTLTRARSGEPPRRFAVRRPDRPLSPRQTAVSSGPTPVMKRCGRLPGGPRAGRLTVIAIAPAIETESALPNARSPRGPRSGVVSSTSRGPSSAVRRPSAR